MWWQAGAWREAARCHGVTLGGKGWKWEAGSAVILNYFLMVLLPVAIRSPGDAAEGNTSMTVLAVVRVGSRTSEGDVNRCRRWD